MTIRLAPPGPIVRLLGAPRPAFPGSIVEFQRLFPDEDTPLAAFQTLHGLGALHQASSYAQISHRCEITQTEQTG